VKSVNKFTEFTIDHPTPNSIISLSSRGLLFKFVNSRYSLYDELPSDNTLLQFPLKTKIWVDNDGSGNWVVYQKIKNYNRYSVLGAASSSREKLGWSLTKAKKSNVFMVGAPGYKTVNNTGTVFVYAEKSGGVEIKLRLVSDPSQVEAEKASVEGRFIDSACIYYSLYQAEKEFETKVRYGLGLAQALINAGEVVNPHTQMLFRSPQLRQFSYSFKMIPRTIEEAREMVKIVQFFRVAAYPETGNGGDQSGTGTIEMSTFKFPDIFEITFLNKGKENKNMISQMHSYLTSVNVTYNSSTPAFYADGMPSVIDLQLTFQESKALNRALIMKGY
jgi:hypothetical protein